MKFAPCPANDFAEFIATYFKRCSERVPEIEGNAGKWCFEDLVPGMSDFDTRFFVRDSMTAEGWCRMSMEVGRVHFELARERKEWARNLEHLPGVNLTWSELLDPKQYFPEFSQWTFHHGNEKRLKAARTMAAGHKWTADDERYHWKKISIYYGPYNRTIDPAINLGVYENKYPLHSRLLHYLAPPVHSAVCLMEKKSTPGKLEAMWRAKQLFPNPKTMQRVMDLIASHYESPDDLKEPGLTSLDEELTRYLECVVETLIKNGAALECPKRPSVKELKNAVAVMNGPPSFSQLFENAKFARLMKGRLWFYGQDLSWFDSAPLVRNELNRMRANFFEGPLRFYVKLAMNKDVSAHTALNMMEGNVLDRAQVEACRKFAYASRPECPDSELKQRAREIAEIFDPFLHALESLLRRATTDFGK